MLDFIFTFPKTAEFRVEDNDVEFSMVLGRLSEKQKFHLKDMVYGGKLAL